ncbi:hypothetical protein F5883DRAFT_205330 [Diaporthe sp. PMI_573]|nr:hypothetical protein F5883DRAFT_205330 [Diaporthaceae sp. PMI_573]
MIESSGNPFLLSAEEMSPVEKLPCTAPGCKESVASGYPACPFHLRGAVSPDLYKSIDKQHPSDPSYLNRSRTAGAVDAEITARKSVAARPAFLSTASKAKCTKTSVSSRPTLNQSIHKGSHFTINSFILRKVHPEPPRSPSGKKRRIASPETGGPNPRVLKRKLDTRNPSNGSLTVPNSGFPLPNGNRRFSYPARDQRKTAEQTTRFDTNQTQCPLNDGGLDFGPVTIAHGDGSNNHPRKAGLRVSFAEPTILDSANMRPSSTRDKIGWKQRRDPGPVKARKDQQTPSSAYGGLQPAIRIPPLEKQRQRLARTHDTSAFDKIIYRQEGSSQPPLGVAVPPEHSLQKRGNVFYGHINPRTHWTQQRSCEWHERKLTEIKGRGGRKANFGKAARRMKDQRLSEDPRRGKKTCQIASATMRLG